MSFQLKEIEKMDERKVKLEIRDMSKKYDNGDGVEHINLKVYEDFPILLPEIF